MQAFHNDINIKNKYVQRMKDHIAADELIRGEGFNEYGKGCAVGCTLNNYNHEQYPIELGIPEWLAHVEDTLFEGMILDKSKTFPLLFLEAINVGADLDKIKAPFLTFILESTLDKFDHDKFPNVLKSIKDVINLINLYKSGETTNLDLFKDAADAVADAAAADAVADAAAADAVAATAYDAAYAAAAYDADAAARAAAHAAAAAARADAAIRAAAHAADAAIRAAATRANAYNKHADKLLELIRECK